jgi:hypothetical protein
MLRDSEDAYPAGAVLNTMLVRAVDKIAGFGEAFA